MNSRKFWIITLCITFCLLIFSGGAVAGYLVNMHRDNKIVHVDLEIQAEEDDVLPVKYNFLTPQLSNYICSLSTELKIDSDLVVAILMVENPEFNPDATHKNENGTIDCGLFQLNDAYVYTTFKNAYWDLTVDFNPFNWKHNAFIAMHHIEYLQRKLKIQDEVIMAYNCGAGNVLNNTVPESTRTYLSRVKNNLALLKSL